MSLDTRNRRLGPWDTEADIIDSISDLENTNVKCTWFESIASGTSGTITPPTGSTILLDEWAAGVDVLVSGISSGVPTFASVIDTEGAIITGTLDAAGAWTISGTPGDGYPISLIYVYRIALSSFNQAYCLESSTIEGVNTLSLLGDLGNELSGFPDDYRDQSTIAFDDGSLTFTITPVGDKFSAWVLGNEFIYSAAETQVIPDTEGIHWIYFDSDGAIQVVTNPTEAQEETAIKRTALMAYILWDATNKTATIFADERHGLTMDGSTHLYLHEVVGYAYYEGLTAGDITADGDGDLDASATLSITNGTLFDEDIKYETSDSGQTLSTPAQIPIFYMDGVAGTWRKDAADNFPVKSIVGGGGRLAYNSYSAPNWSQTEIDDKKFVLCHIFATNDIDEPIIAVQGQGEYNKKKDAREGAETELLSMELIGLPAQEHTPLYTLIYECKDDYDNTPKARIITTDLGDDYIDWRVTKVGSGGGGGSGDVVGPSSATDLAIALFDGATGNVIQESALTITAGVIAGVGFELTTPIINTIYTAATKTGATFTEDGAAALYYNEIVTLATEVTGIAVSDTSGDDPHIRLLSDIAGVEGDLYLLNDTFYIGIGTEKALHATLNGDVALYYDDVKKASTTTTGFDLVANAHLTVTGTGLVRVGTANEGTFGNDGTDTIINTINTDPLKLRNSTDGEELIVATPGGSVALYYDGSLAATTSSDGLLVYDEVVIKDPSSVPSLRYRNSANFTVATITHGGTDMIMRNFTNGGRINIQADSSAASTETMALLDPDGSVDLYYDGSVSMKTQIDGITVKDTNSTGPVILLIDNNDTTMGQVFCSANQIGLKVGSSLETAFLAEINGAASLYYNNVVTMATTVTGIETDTVQLEETAGGADHTVSGLTVNMTVGENVVFGDFLYMKSDGKLWKSDADSETTMVVIAMAAASISADAEGIVLLTGFVRDDTYTWTVGDPIYASTTAGAGTQTAPSVSGDQVQKIGIATHADRMLFKPSLTVIEI